MEMEDYDIEMEGRWDLVVEREDYNMGTKNWQDVLMQMEDYLYLYMEEDCWMDYDYLTQEVDYE